MTAPTSMGLAGVWRERIGSASPDLLRAMIKTFAGALVGAEVDAVCGAGYGERSTEQVNSGDGYRARGWGTRAGTVELAIPKLVVSDAHRGLVSAVGAAVPGATWRRCRTDYLRN